MRITLVTRGLVLPDQASAWAGAAVRSAGGLIVIASCVQAGVAIQAQFGLPVPGNVLGMVLLLTMLSLKVVPDSWISRPCSWLLLLLPALFVPVYATALANPALWLQERPMLAAAVAGVALTLGMAAVIAVRTRQS